ncbi:MAG: sugar phosphate isomerase/epimerase family protein [Candidatus Helarchaeales archaeon]
MAIQYEIKSRPKILLSIDRSLYHTPIKKVYELAAELNVDGLEIQLEHPELWKSYPNGVVKQIEEISSSYSFRHTLHAPIKDLNVSSYNQAIRKASIQELKLAMDIGAKMGVDYVLIHLGKNPFVSTSRMSKMYKNIAIQHSIEAVKEIISFHPEITVTIENMTWSEWRLSSKIKFLEKVFPELPENVRFTLDIEHARERSRVYVRKFHERFKNRLISIHVGDVFRQESILKEIINENKAKYLVLEPHTLPNSSRQELLFPIIKRNINKLKELLKSSIK